MKSNEIGIPPTIPVTICGKDYNFRRVNLDQLVALQEIDDKLAQVQLQIVTTEADKKAEAEQIWSAWCAVAFDGDFPPFGSLTFGEAREVRDYFFGLMSGARKPDGTLMTLPGTRSPVLPSGANSPSGMSTPT